MINRTLVILFSTLLLFSCVPNTNPMLTEISIDYSDPITKRILKYEILQEKDSLTSFFNHPDPTYRYLAAKAFASFQNESVLSEMDSLLRDPITEVKAMAAYAMGQSKSSKAQPFLINAFKSRDTSSVDNVANSRILEAVGKVGGNEMLNAISSISTYLPTDTLLLMGQVRALYQFALRGMNNKQGTERIIEFVNSETFSPNIRLMAAHYLSRSKDLNLDDYKFQLTQAFIKEQNPNIKMALALSLKNTIDPEVQTILLDQLKLDLDYRVRCNIIRALSTQSYILGAEKVIPILNDDNLTVAQCAAEFFIQNGNKDDAAYYRNLAREDRHWSVKTRLYTAVMKNLPYYYTKTLSATRWEILNKIKEIEEPYERAGYIGVLGHDPGSYPELIKLLEKEESIPVQTAIYSALGQIAGDEEFDLTFSGSSRYAQRTILDAFNAGLESGNAGAIAVIGDALASDQGRLKTHIDSTTIIELAKEKLKLPRDIEAYNSLEKALANLKGVSNPVLTKVNSNFEPNFELLDQFKESREVIIKTSRGNFNIQLDVQNAPISVLNFLELINSDYYDGKVVHRVVPNFVIQTGCNRGDGYGSLDYTLRSEVGPVYYDNQGYVGLASAGPHTESSQWFVTHSPTPHLDGKYTIFGKVVSGMEVIHQMQIGDVIEDIIVKVI